MKKIILCSKESADVVTMVSNKDRLKLFVCWLSANNLDDDVSDIAESFDILEFSIEDLLTTVKSSGLFSSQLIDRRILYLVKEIKCKMEKAKQVINRFSDVIPFESLLEIQNMIELGI